jgi:nitrite reductase/ring-hydroxylating ferredoxin subunit
MEVVTLKRTILQRLFGISATKIPADPGCWTAAAGKLVINLARAPELGKPGGAIRLEGKNMGQRILVVHGEDGNYYAFGNRCRHMGRRLDPVPGTGTVQCCSVGKTTYAYDGKVLSGPAKESVVTFAVLLKNGELSIEL